MISIEELKEDGSILIIKWLAICVLTGVALGAMAGSAKVIIFETNEYGSTAEYRDCIDYDYEAARIFEDQYVPDPSEKISPPDFCRQYSIVTAPAGKRAREIMKLYGLYGGGIGFTVGLLIGTQKSEKHKALERIRQEQDLEKRS